MRTLKYGQTYGLIGDAAGYQDFYILAHVAPATVTLISLRSGNRWNEPVELSNPDAGGTEIGATEAEYEKIFRGSGGSVFMEIDLSIKPK